MVALVIILFIPLLIGLAYLIFWLVMLMDAVKKNHLVWVVVIFLLHFIGPILYYLTEYRNDASSSAKPVKSITSKAAAKKTKPAPRKRTK